MATMTHEVELDPQETGSFVVEADNEEEVAHIVEADDADETLIVSLEDEEEPQQTATAELWASSEEFLRFVRKAAEYDACVNKHSVNTLRAAIAHLQDVSREIVRTAISTDFDNDQLAELDRLEEHIERDTIELTEALVNLEAARNKAIVGDLESKGLIKKAFKSADVQLFADPFTYGITRLCINAKVANGKNIEEVFAQLSEHFDLTDREKFAVALLMRDSGYPIRGSLIGDIDQIKQYFG